MKVLYQSRVDLYDPKGGDTIGMHQTKDKIEKIDSSIKIDIKPVVKCEDIEEYDIVHLFNIDWVCETYVQAAWAKQHKKPVILSAIHHSEKEIVRYEKESRYDIRRISNFFIPWQSTRDVSKNIARCTVYRKFQKIYPTLIQMIKSIREEQREIIKMSDIVLVQTNVEASDIKEDFKTEEFKWKKVVNGVNARIFQNSNPEEFRKKMLNEHKIDISSIRIVLNVGRVEARKNQLKLIEAFEKLQTENKEYSDVKLVFIGAMTVKSPEYKYRFNRKLKKNDNIIYLGAQSLEFVASAMSHQGIYVQSSWFETTGLVSLEASLAGMPVAASGDRIEEYLGEYADYCDPGSAISIKSAMVKAFTRQRVDDKLKDEIINKYTWNNTAKQTIAVYKEIMQNNAD